MGLVLKGVGNPVTKDAEQALAVCFALVFMGKCCPRSSGPEGKSGARKAYPVWVRLKCLDKPDAQKFVVPDEVHPSVLQELIDVITKNLQLHLRGLGNRAWFLGADSLIGSSVGFPSMLILWAGAWAASFSWPCFEQVIGLDDLWSFIPILAIL